MQLLFSFSNALWDYFERIDRQFNRPIELSPVPGETYFINRTLGNIKVILWDIYGTLCGADTGDLERSLASIDPLIQAAACTLEEFQLNDAWQKITPDAQPSHRLRERYLELIRQSHEQSRNNGIEYPEVLIEHIWLNILQQCQSAGWHSPYPEPLIDTAFRAAYFFDTAFQHTYLYSGCFNCLSALKSANIMQGLISNAQFYTPIRLRRLLRLQSGREQLELQDLFNNELLFFSYQLGFSKPNLHSFRQALDILARQNIAPQQILYIGNDMLNDIWAAGQCGLRTLLFAGDRNQLVLRRDDPRCQICPPDVTVTSLMDIPALIVPYG